MVVVVICTVKVDKLCFTTEHTNSSKFDRQQCVAHRDSVIDRVAGLLFPRSPCCRRGLVGL